MVKEDCFAFDKDKKCCKALKETYCAKEGCGFYKTAEKQKKSLEKAEKRLRRIK